MKKAMAYVTLLLSLAPTAHAGDVPAWHIRHLSPGQVFSGPCERMERTLAPGEAFGEAVPAGSITSVEVQADEIGLPDPIILYILRNGKFGVLTHPISVPAATAMRLMLAGGQCLQMNMLLDPANNQLSSVATDIGTLLVPSPVAACGVTLPSLIPGMTREEAGKSLRADGGLSTPFTLERYVVQHCTTQDAAVKVNLAFKPAGMSDKTYQLGKWQRPPQKPQDVLMRVSPYYLESAVAD